MKAGFLDFYAPSYTDPFFNSAWVTEMAIELDVSISVIHMNVVESMWLV